MQEATSDRKWQATASKKQEEEATEGPTILQPLSLLANGRKSYYNQLDMIY